VDESTKTVLVSKFKPRWYQRDLINAIEHSDKRKFIAIFPRRAGKDVVALNIMLRQAFKRVGVYYYLYPEKDQCRKAVWDSILITGEKFLDFIPKELIAKKNEAQMKITLVNGSIIEFNGCDRADCYDNKTEILTDRGWLLFSGLTGKEKVATLKDGCMVYEKPTDYIEQDYSGDMYSVKNDAIDMLVTPNHRFFVRSGKGVYKFKRISDPTIARYSIPARSDWHGKKRKTFTFPGTNITISMEDFMALLGIYLSEGSSYRGKKGYSVCIAQKKPHVRSKIEELLDRCGLNYKKRADAYYFYSKDLYSYFSQFGLQCQRYIPRFVLELDKSYLKTLFDWLVLGDGTVRKNGSTLYYSCSKQLIDDVQELILKIGYCGYVYIKAKAGSPGGIIRGRQITYKHDLYQIRVRTSKFKYFSSTKKSYISKKHYSGKVYCVTVPSGVIKVRRNGRECWSGNSLRGSNPVGVVFSEFAQTKHPHAYDGVIAPVLTANKGWVMFISTPYGHNRFYDLYKYARSGEDPTWYTKLLTVNDTQHMDPVGLARERARMSEELFMQEYFCSFEIAGDGYFYSKYIQQAYSEGRIGFVPHDPTHNVHTAWDLGWACPTVILFYQIIEQKVCVIDMYHKRNEKLAHYVSTLNMFAREKNYNYGEHFVPHDSKKHSLNDGLTRIQMLEQLGIKVTRLDRGRLTDGIEVVRNTFARIFIDENKCRKLVSALESYAQKKNDKTDRFMPTDTETWANDYCDAFRYMCMSLSKMSSSVMSTEEFNLKRQKLRYGKDSYFSPVFRSR